MGALTGMILNLGAKDSVADLTSVSFHRDEPDGSEIGKAEFVGLTRNRGVQFSVAQQVAEIERSAKLKVGLR